MKLEVQQKKLNSTLRRMQPVFKAINALGRPPAAPVSKAQSKSPMLVEAAQASGKTPNPNIYPKIVP